MAISVTEPKPHVFEYQKSKGLVYPGVRYCVCDWPESADCHKRENIIAYLESQLKELQKPDNAPTVDVIPSVEVTVIVTDSVGTAIYKMTMQNFGMEEKFTEVKEPVPNSNAIRTPPAYLEKLIFSGMPLPDDKGIYYYRIDQKTGV